MDPKSASKLDGRNEDLNGTQEHNMRVGGQVGPIAGTCGQVKWGWVGKELAFGRNASQITISIVVPPFCMQPYGWVRREG
jgi:hypothetical protein